MKNRKFIMPALLGVAVLTLVGALALKSVPVEAEAKSSDELMAQLKELEEDQANIEAELERLDGLLADNATELEALVAQKNVIDQEIT